MSGWWEQGTRVLGVVMNMVGIYNLIKNELPEKQADRTGFDAQVRIYEALLDQGAFVESFGSEVASSTAPSIAAFNELGQCIGVANTIWDEDDTNRIENGAFRDFTIPQTAGPGQQVAFLQIYATGTPVCVSGVTMRWADGTPTGFSGDFGRACGAAWYYSNVRLGDNGHQPDCFWLDSGNRDNRYTKGEECKRLKKQCGQHGNNCIDCDEEDTALSYQFPRYSRSLPKAMQYTVSKFDVKDEATVDTTDPKFFCAENYLTFRHLLNANIEYRPPHYPYPYPGEQRNPVFSTDTVTLFEQGSDLADGERKARDIEMPFNSNYKWEYYISSSREEHSATQLCASLTALGPDFYSEQENKFCDMNPTSGLRTLYDGCDFSVEPLKLPCWDYRHHHLLSESRKLGRKRDGKRYTHQVAWKANGLKSVIRLLANATATGVSVGSSSNLPMTGLPNATLG